MSELLFRDESYAIVGACIQVHETMGQGFLEAVYHECLEIEFAKQNIPFLSKHPLRLNYNGQVLEKTYEADFILYDQILLEIKAVKNLADEHTAQILNYLNATGLQLGLLINFGSPGKLERKRFAKSTP